MGCLGVLFAISAPTAQALLDAASDDEVLEIVESLEEDWIEEHLCELDKAWEAMHRALSDGSLDFERGDFPLNRAVLGGRQLYAGDDYLIALVTAAEVPEVARALAVIDEAALRDRYDRVVPHDYAPEYGADDLAYTWSYLQQVRDFYAGAARDGRAVVFSVDQ
jgi:hypothetical protein